MKHKAAQTYRAGRKLLWTTLPDPQGRRFPACAAHGTQQKCLIFSCACGGWLLLTPQKERGNLIRLLPPYQTWRNKFGELENSNWNWPKTLSWPQESFFPVFRGDKGKGKKTACQSASSPRHPPLHFTASRFAPCYYSAAVIRLKNLQRPST